MFDEVPDALDPAVPDVAHLVRVEVRPLLAVEVLVERLDSSRLAEVHERVAQVALVLG